MTFWNSTLWLLFTLLMPVALVAGIAETILLHAFIAHTLVSWAHMVRYVHLRSKKRMLIRLALLLVGPMVGFVQTMLLVPVRLYALATPGAKGWGSRVRGQLSPRTAD